MDNNQDDSNKLSSQDQDQSPNPASNQDANAPKRQSFSTNVNSVKIKPVFYGDNQNTDAPTLSADNSAQSNTESRATTHLEIVPDVDTVHESDNESASLDGVATDAYQDQVDDIVNLSKNPLPEAEADFEDYQQDHYPDQDDQSFDDGSVETGYIPIPGVDDSFYEDETDLDYQDFDSVDSAIAITPKDNSDDSAVLFSKIYGVGGVMRENAHLTQDIKTYRRNFYLASLVSICLSLLCLMLLFSFRAYPKTRYIPTYDNKAICEVTPENNPNITDVAISDFAKDAILNLYTFDYVNYDRQINSTLDRWFTSKGRVDTIAAMDSIKILEFVKNNALTLQAGTTSAAKIEQKGRSQDGEPYWIVRFPLIIDIYSGAANPEDSQRYIVTVRVTASTSSAQNPKGLGVVSATLAPDN